MHTPPTVSSTDPRDLSASWETRLVLESKLQHEGVYIFVDGIRWWSLRQREVKPETFTCVYGPYWRARAIRGKKGGHLAVLCPHPPRRLKSEFSEGRSPRLLSRQEGEEVEDRAANGRPATVLCPPATVLRQPAIGSPPTVVHPLTAECLPPPASPPATESLPVVS